MDPGSPVGVSVSEHINGSDDLQQLYVAPGLSTCDVPEDAYLNELGRDLTKMLHIQDVQELELESILCQPFDKTGNDNLGKKYECSNSDETNILNNEKCMEGNHQDGDNDKGEDDITAAELMEYQGNESVKPPSPQSLSLPTPSKLVSAMKGSREKQGMPSRKLNVTWAPDVYDPPPSASLFVRIKKPKKNHESRRNGKYKQKGKPSKGDKKHFRKHSGYSTKYYQYQSLNDGGRVYESCRDLEAFDVGSVDSFCGSSFLHKSVTKLHFSIAEAI